MAFPKVARRALKTGLFLIIMLWVGRSLGNPEIYVNHNFADWVCNLIYGDVNAETIYDTYFYIDVVTVVSITIAIYFITIEVVNKNWPPR